MYHFPPQLFTNEHDPTQPSEISAAARIVCDLFMNRREFPASMLHHDLGQDPALFAVILCGHPARFRRIHVSQVAMTCGVRLDQSFDTDGH